MTNIVNQLSLTNRALSSTSPDYLLNNSGDNALQPDIMALLLANKSNSHTQRAYRRDITDFFLTIFDKNPSPALVLDFLALPEQKAVWMVEQYRKYLKQKGFKKTTVNRKIAVIKSLVQQGKQVGVCDYSLKRVTSEKINPQEDRQRLISSVTFARVINYLDKTTPKGKRDYALLHLLWHHSLKRGEIVQANVADYCPQSKTLSLKLKSKFPDRKIIGLSSETIAGLNAWLDTRESQPKKEEPLFIALDRANWGHRLTGAAVYWIVVQSFQQAGILTKVSPQQIRDSSPYNVDY